ncbi:MAG TPA: YsnF/AvaK domain-containing protein [Dehalococcoidia bacterium]|nr:YsnF/AvaK domain-containing protein [Dehalococcoidia bacterium]
MAQAYERGHREVEGWGDIGDRFKSSWQQRFGNSGAKWEDYEPRYRYGHEMWNKPEYRGKQWHEVEPHFQRDWQTRYADKPWEQAGSSVRDAWENFHGWETQSQGRTESPRTIELREEVLVPHKQQVEAGEVRLTKDVTAEQRSVEVPVTREEVMVERHAVDRRPASGDIGESSEVIDVPVYEERASADKQTFVREEVSLGKRVVQDTEHVSDTVRREEARVETEGQVHPASADRDFEARDQDFRR